MKEFNTLIKIVSTDGASVEFQAVVWGKLARGKQRVNISKRKFNKWRNRYPLERLHTSNGELYTFTFYHLDK